MIGMSSNPFSSSLETNFSDCPLADKYKAFSPEQSDIASLDKPIAKNPEAVKNFAAATESTQPKDVTDNPEKGKPIQNKIDGLRREAEVQAELEKQYPADKGYEIVPEAYLRDARGNIVKDPVTGKARRVDFVVVKDNKVVDSVEVTSKTADKTEQLAKETRIRNMGGNYIYDANGNLAEYSDNVSTRVERRD